MIHARIAAQLPGAHPQACKPVDRSCVFVTQAETLNASVQLVLRFDNLSTDNVRGTLLVAAQSFAAVCSTELDALLCDALSGAAGPAAESRLLLQLWFVLNRCATAAMLIHSC